MKDSLEFTVLGYALAWTQEEKSLHGRLRKDSSAKDIRDALRYFGVARNFARIHKDSVSEAALRTFTKVRDAKGLAAEDQVIELAKYWRKRFGRNISAASKLLWLANPARYIIYDARALAALNARRSADSRHIRKGAYAEYCEAWRKEYRRERSMIVEATSRLTAVRGHLSTDSPLRKLMPVTRRESFRMRVFDHVLWKEGRQT